MHQINPFFMIGMVGMLATSILQILLALFLTEKSIQTSSSIMYPVFIVFLLLGTWIMIKRKNNLPGDN